MYSVSDSFLEEGNDLSLTPDGQVVYVHLVPVVILYGVDKGIPFGFVQVNFTVCCLHDFIYRGHKHHHYFVRYGEMMRGKEQTQRFRRKWRIGSSIRWYALNRWKSVEYLWTLCRGRWTQAPLPAEPLRVFHGNDWWSSWSPRRRAKRSTCMSPVGCGKAPLCSSIKLPPPYLCTAKGKKNKNTQGLLHQFCSSCRFHIQGIWNNITKVTSK